jgi:hypothetical protein
MVVRIGYFKQGQFRDKKPALGVKKSSKFLSGIEIPLRIGSLVLNSPRVMEMEKSMEMIFLETNGIRLHAVQAGPEDGPLVILLHGFPEFWYGWRGQIEPLALPDFVTPLKCITNRV